MTRKIIDFFSIMSKIIDSKRWMRGQVFLDQTSAACDAKVHFHRCIRNKLYDEWFFYALKQSFSMKNSSHVYFMILINSWHETIIVEKHQVR